MNQQYSGDAQSSLHSGGAKTDDRYYASFYADKTSPRTPPYKRGDTSDNYATLTPSERRHGINAIQQQGECSYRSHCRCSVVC